MILLCWFVIPILAWVINLFAACYVIEKNCLQRGDNPPPTVGQTLVKYIVLTAIMFAVYSGFMLLGPTIGKAVIVLTGKLGPTTPVWICGALAATFFVWEIYRHKSIPFAHLASGADEIGFGGLAISVIVWTVAILFTVSYIFRNYVWNNSFYF